MFHVQIQEPTSRSTITRTFVFLAKFAEFYCYEIFEQEVDDDLSICVDERSPCGLSITGDKDKPLYKDLSRVMCHYVTLSKGNGVTTAREKCPIAFYTELLLLPKFDNSCSSVTRDKEICHVIMS